MNDQAHPERPQAARSEPQESVPPPAAADCPGKGASGAAHRGPVELARELAQMCWRVARVAYLGFGFGGSYVLAAAIAFYSVICMGPLGILLAAGLQALFGPRSDTYAHMHQAASEIGGRAADQIILEIDGLLANPDAHVASVFSVVMLIWAGLRLFETLERTLTGVWPGRILRGYIGRKLVALVMMLVAGALLAAFVLLDTTLALAREWLGRFPQMDPALLLLLRPRFLSLAQFGLAAVAFTLVYKFVPVQRVPVRVAVIGGLCAALLWHAVPPIFLYTITRSSRYSSIYGGLGGVVVFSLWAFAGAWVLLFGAHFAAAYEHVFVKREPSSSDDHLIGHPRSAERPSAAPPAER